MDLVIHLPTCEGFNSVFTIVERFYKYVTFIPCKATCTDPELARVFYNHIVCKFAMPKKILSDREIRFLLNFW